MDADAAEGARELDGESGLDGDNEGDGMDDGPPAAATSVAAQVTMTRPCRVTRVNPCRARSCGRALMPRRSADDYS